MSTTGVGAESTAGAGAGSTTGAGAGSTVGASTGPTAPLADEAGRTVDTGSAKETVARATSSCCWASEPEGVFRPFFTVRRRSPPKRSSSSSSSGSSMTRRGTSSQATSKVQSTVTRVRKQEQDTIHRTRTCAGCRGIRGLPVVSTPVDVHRGRGSGGSERFARR